MDYCDKKKKKKKEAKGDKPNGIWPNFFTILKDLFDVKDSTKYIYSK